MLEARRLAIIVTLKCTLNCKLCCNCITMYENPPILDKKIIFEDIKGAFQIYDRIEWLQFVGGELFIHPDMHLILEEALKYKEKFDKIILMSNGTIIPNDKTLALLSENSNLFEVQLSDYGDLSYKIRDIEKIFTKMHIPYVTKAFFGDMQHYGGWVDSGDFEDRGYSESELKEVFDNCWQISMKNLHVYNGKLHNCIRSLFALDLEMIDIPCDEYVDLRNDDMTLEKKKEIAKGFNTKPLKACRVCNGFDSKKSKRYPAAEQV